MKRCFLTAFAVVIVIAVGCHYSSRRGTVEFANPVEAVGEMVFGGDSDYDRSRRAWDQTTDHHR